MDALYAMLEAAFNTHDASARFTLFTNKHKQDLDASMAELKEFIREHLVTVYAELNVFLRDTFVGGGFGSSSLSSAASELWSLLEEVEESSCRSATITAQFTVKWADKEEEDPGRRRLLAAGGGSSGGGSGGSGSGGRRVSLECSLSPTGNES